jgi:hypothetical protein
MSRSVDWVEQDMNSENLLWRQGKREVGQFPVIYTDRRLDFVEQDKPKYSEANQKKLVDVFSPLIAAMRARYGNFSWWHYDYPTGTLLYGSANDRQQVTANDVVKQADLAFVKFTKILSTLHGHTIGPAKES